MCHVCIYLGPVVDLLLSRACCHLGPRSILLVHVLYSSRKFSTLGAPMQQCARAHRSQYAVVEYDRIHAIRPRHVLNLNLVYLHGYPRGLLTRVSK